MSTIGGERRVDHEHSSRGGSARDSRRRVARAYSDPRELAGSPDPSGISILPVPDGTVIHPTAAARTKFCSSHNRPAPETVTQPALTCDRLEPLFSGHFSDTGPHLRRFFAGVPR